MLRSPELGPPSALPELEGARPWYLPRTFDSLRFRPFRWYIGAMLGWNAAMAMQMLVRGFLAYRLTGSFAALGFVGLGSAIPMLVLSPFGGVVADRASRRLVLQLGQAFSIVVALVVAGLVFTDVLALWHLFVASILQGAMVSLVMPSRQALLPEVVGMRRLTNAIPLQSAGMNLMQIVAPALGGFLIDWVGAGFVYVFMAAMYSVSVTMLFFVESLSPEELAASRANTATDGRAGPAVAAAVDDDEAVPGTRWRTLSDLVNGARYLMRDHTVLSVLAFSFVGAVLGMPIRLLLPGYVAAVFDDDGSTLGLLQMGMGLGALVAALGLASLHIARYRGLLFAGSSVVIGVSMIAFSMTSVAWLAWLGLLVVGIGSAGRQALGQVLLQEYVDDDYRGRVMSIYMMQFSMMMVGAFLVGVYMEHVGPEFAIGSLGAVLIVATAAFLVLVPKLRRLA